jgi:alkylation response protein AidB-like acyl-CoA dehydrogenase
MRVAEAAVELKTARLLIQAAAERCDQVGVTGEPTDTETRAELKWNASYAVELSRRATERFFAISAANAIYNDSRLQGRYRDVNTACQHAIADFDSTAEMRGPILFALDPGSTLL